MKNANNEDAAATLLQANARRSQAKKEMQAKRDDKEQNEAATIMQRRTRKFNEAKKAQAAKVSHEVIEVSTNNRR